jgi:hypothetical protein
MPFSCLGHSVSKDYLCEISPKVWFLRSSSTCISLKKLVISTRAFICRIRLTVCFIFLCSFYLYNFSIVNKFFNFFDRENPIRFPLWSQSGKRIDRVVFQLLSEILPKILGWGIVTFLTGNLYHKLRKFEKQWSSCPSSASKNTHQLLRWKAVPKNS